MRSFNPSARRLAESRISAAADCISCATGLSPSRNCSCAWAKVAALLRMRISRRTSLRALRNSSVLASHTVQVTSEAKASPMMTPFTIRSAFSNMPQGERSSGSSAPLTMCSPAGGSLAVGAIAFGGGDGAAAGAIAFGGGADGATAAGAGVAALDGAGVAAGGAAALGVFGVVALSGLGAIGATAAGAGAGLVCARAEGASGPAISSMAAKAAASLLAKARGESCRGARTLCFISYVPFLLMRCRPRSGSRCRANMTL